MENVMDKIRKAKMLLKEAREYLECPECYETKKMVAKEPWSTLPKGWTDESVKKFWKSLTGDSKHKVTKCIERMKDKFDDPGAFCASLADKVTGTTKWRGKKK